MHLGDTGLQFRTGFMGEIICRGVANVQRR